MSSEAVAKRIKLIYDEAIEAEHEAVDGIESVDVNVVNNDIVAELHYIDGIDATWTFRVYSGKVYDENGMRVNLESFNTFFCTYSGSLLDVEDLVTNHGLISLRVDNTQLYFDYGANKYEICIPHSGNDYKWLFRKANKKTFDKWGNCDEEVLYDTVDALKGRLARELA